MITFTMIIDEHVEYISLAKYVKNADARDECMTHYQQPTCLAALEWLSNTQNWQSPEELEEQQLMLQCCQCMDCNCLLQHNKVAMELRSKTRQQLQRTGWELAF